MRLQGSTERQRNWRTVIVRLDRTIQYSRAVEIRSRGPGVLDSRRSLSSGSPRARPVVGHDDQK